MSTEQDQIRSAIAALESQREVLGEAVVDTALAPLHKRLRELEAATPRRRLVSVLFLDIVGSTAMSSGLDPEDVHEIMDAALSRFSELVVSHGGTVLQYAGDSLLAGFGVERTQEDDAERAVRAALSLLEASHVQAEIVARASSRDDLGFQIRVGVHTGHVLLGGGVDAESSIRGFTVNIAARMEQTASPGSLRISQETWRHVRGIFEVQPQPPLLVKGSSEPLQTYFVLGAKPRAFRVPNRGIDGVETPLIGRAQDLDRLLATIEATRTDRTLHACTVLGDAGVGKSRLMHELQQRLDDSTHATWLLLGRSQPSSRGQPYGLLRDVISWRLQIADSDRGHAARQELLDGLAPYFPGEDELQAELLGHLIGMDFSESPRLAAIAKDARLLRDRAFAAFSHYIRALTLRDGSSVVLLLDDLQWTDAGSLEWLGHLLRQLDLPLSVIMAARPEFLERQPSWLHQDHGHLLLRLDVLEGSERHELTAAMLRRVGQIPPQLQEIIEQQAEGNPFYAEELIKMLIDDQVIMTASDPWQVVPEKLQAERIPTTLTGVLQARIDTLHPNQRRALQMASVIGPVFWDEAVTNLHADASESMSLLRDRALVKPHSSSVFDGLREQEFQHHFIHQVTYESVLMADRRIGHARAASWMAERVGDRAAEYLAVTAEHYEKGGDPARAEEWYLRAANAAEARFANRLALDYIERLLGLENGRDLRARIRLLIRQAGLADVIADRVLQARALDEALGLSTTLKDEGLAARVLALQALLADHVGDRDQAWDYANQAAELAERSGAAGAAALAHGNLAWICKERGQAQEALRHIDIARTAARQASVAMEFGRDDIYENQVLLQATAIYVHIHDYLRARAEAERALEVASRQASPRMVAYSHIWLAWIAVSLADTQSLGHHIEAMTAVTREIGLVLGESNRLSLGAELAALKGDPANAAELFSKASLAYDETGDAAHAAWALARESLMWVQMGDIPMAQRRQERALELFGRLNFQDDMRGSRLLIADCRRIQGDLGVALAMVEPELVSIDKVGSLDASHSSLEARMAAWRVLAASKDPRAQRQIEIAKQELDRRTEKITEPAVRERVLALALHREIMVA